MDPRMVQHMQNDKFSPEIKLGFVSASRNCFPRELSEKRMNTISAKLKDTSVNFVVAQSRCAIIESKTDAIEAAKFFEQENCDAAVLYLGNFSPEIEDAVFVKSFNKPILLIAAAEESGETVSTARGDALCGLMSASLAIAKRGLSQRVIIPANPIVTADSAVVEIEKFVRICKVIKGISAVAQDKPRRFYDELGKVIVDYEGRNPTVLRYA